MSNSKIAKVISALPATLEKNTLYLVRVGAGFDLYETDSTGTTAHKLNDPDYAAVSAVDDETDVTALELEELTDGSVTDLHQHDKLVSPDGSLDVVLARANGDVTHLDYDSARDDGKQPYDRAVWYAPDGTLQVGEPRSTFIPISGRFYVYADARWTTDSDDNYGTSYYQHNESGGTGADPLLEWEHQGMLLPAGAHLKRLHFQARANSNDIQDFEIRVVVRRPTDLAAYNSGFDNDNEMTNTVIAQRNWVNDIVSPFTGNMNDMHRGVIDLNHTLAEDSQVSIYLRATRTGVTTRYLLTTRTWEIL